MPSDTHGKLSSPDAAVLTRVMSRLEMRGDIVVDSQALVSWNCERRFENSSDPVRQSAATGGNNGGKWHIIP